MDKTKGVHDEQVFLGTELHLGDGIEVFFLLCDTAFFLLNSSILFLLGKNTLHGYSQLDYHLIHLADNHRYYLII